MEYEDFVTGVRDITPAIPPNIPFGMLFGATAVEVGIAPLEAVGMSLFMFAGAGQLAAVDLLRTDTALPIVLITVMVINVRYMIYSASIAPLVRDLSRRWRAVMGYALFDINFAILTSKFQIDGKQRSRHPGCRIYTGDGTTWGLRYQRSVRSLSPRISGHSPAAPSAMD
ncbi:branched-chain amino acid ABC transporter permease [Natrialba swarupiae]|nr:branched-chain amino acid ABC transporter permease [Natrialba swarupiae]